MFLIIIKGTKIGEVFPLNAEDTYVLGRKEECKIHILDPRVSRRHCQIDRTRDGDFYLKDLNSTNKTFVNKKTAEDIIKLKIGDIIEIGDTAMFFTDQKELPVKNIEEYKRMSINQTMKIDIPSE